MAQGIGWIGAASVAVGYLLESIRQRGDCDVGDSSPDTLALSVVLIVLIGGLCGLIGIVGALVGRIRRRWSVAKTIRVALPSVLSLAGSLAIFAVAGSGPSTWFQYCAT
jgi:H+/Cl- antiporter ClcA